MTGSNIRRAVSIGLGALACGVLVAALSMGTGGSATAQQNQKPAQGSGYHLPAPVLEVKQFMDVFNKPLYTDLKNDLKDRPDGDEAWKDIENDALQAAEIANLIAIRKVPQNAVVALHKHAAELQNAGLALAKTAKSRDYDQTRKDWANVVHACNGCHEELAADKGPVLQP